MWEYLRRYRNEAIAAAADERGLIQTQEGSNSNAIVVAIPIVWVVYLTVVFTYVVCSKFS